MTVKTAVLKVLIDNYPLVKTHLIHRAAPFCVTADVRFRELRKEHGLNIRYIPEKKSYKIKTRKSELTKLYKEMTERAA